MFKNVLWVLHSNVHGICVLFNQAISILDLPDEFMTKGGTRNKQVFTESFINSSESSIATFALVSK